jgi:hypothetical protein
LKGAIRKVIKGFRNPNLFRPLLYTSHSELLTGIRNRRMRISAI